MSERYHFHAYVTDGEVRKRHWLTIGRVTFTWIYQNRPDGCRYAVVSRWDVGERVWRYAVLDLFNVLKDDHNNLIPPAPRWTHDDLSAAIMTTVLMYGAG